MNGYQSLSKLDGASAFGDKLGASQVKNRWWIGAIRHLHCSQTNGLCQVYASTCFGNKIQFPSLINIISRLETCIHCICFCLCGAILLINDLLSAATFLRSKFLQVYRRDLKQRFYSTLKMTISGKKQLICFFFYMTNSFYFLNSHTNCMFMFRSTVYFLYGNFKHKSEFDLLFLNGMYDDCGKLNWWTKTDHIYCIVLLRTLTAQILKVKLKTQNHCENKQITLLVWKCFI